MSFERVPERLLVSSVSQLQYLVSVDIFEHTIQIRNDFIQQQWHQQQQIMASE